MLFNLSDTICAICTPSGTGAIAAVRISGPESWKIVREIFTPAPLFQHMQGVHGYIKDEEKVIDEVVILPYKSPKSYTTEDVIEIFCHGGVKVPSIILDLCLRKGARKAQQGEFTFRAFVNGRIDLTSAEAVNELINADNSSLVYASSKVLTGSLREKVNNLKEKILNFITALDAQMEFPQDVPQTSNKDIKKELSSITSELDKLIHSSEEGQLLRQGIKASIVGAPNVGKSSLLNQLLETERAIVTSDPGTTRDTIEEKIFIEGIPFVIVDTAGIRKSHDLSQAEWHGIERTRQAIEKSDITLLVYDLLDGIDNKTNQIIELLDNKTTIMVGNKLDLINEKELNQETQRPLVFISAKYGTNIDKLKKLMAENVQVIKDSNGKHNYEFYINQRQRELLLQANLFILNSLKLLNDNQCEDLIADELKKAIEKLEEITGKRINDDIIKNIFSKFCIGK